MNLLLLIWIKRGRAKWQKNISNRWASQLISTLLTVINIEKRYFSKITEKFNKRMTARRKISNIFHESEKQVGAKSISLDWKNNWSSHARWIGVEYIFFEELGLELGLSNFFRCYPKIYLFTTILLPRNKKNIFCLNSTEFGKLQELVKAQVNC